MSDHSLAVTGLVVGLVGVISGILAAYYFYLKARERIDPRYILRHEPLVDSSSGAMAEVSVRYRDAKVTNLNRCLLIIWNKGNRVITRASVAENDKIRLGLPDDATALGAGILWSSRAAIDLSSCVSNTGSTVSIDFAFLDADDGGVIEILYQGDPNASPTLMGSIMGAPKGIRPTSSRIILEELEEDDTEDEESGWKGYAIPAVAVCASAVVSSILLGAAYPLTVVLYTLSAELVIIAIFFAYLVVHIRRTIGSGRFWRDIPPLRIGKQLATSQADSPTSRNA